MKEAVNNIVISIIIPAYNCEEYIEECVESIMTSFRESRLKSGYEVIIVNDGSTDETEIKVLKLETRYHQVKVLNQKNLGVSVARNNGVFSAKGKYITFVDGDDYVCSEEYLRVCEYTIKNDFDITCFGMTEKTDKSSKEIKFRNIDNYTNFIKYPKYMNSVCNKIFKKSILDNNSILFDDQLKTCEDLLFVIQAFTCSTSVVYLDMNAYIYRRNMASVTKSHNRVRECKDELVASQRIKKLSYDKGIEDCIQISDYWRMVSAMRNLKDIDVYDIEEYRKKNPQRLTWKYTLKPSYWLLSFFANYRMDIIPKIYIALKRRRYS